MARVVVVGGGFGGMAAAARLARLGHEVTLLERAEHLGGALTTVEQDGFAWDAGPTTTLLPAVVRRLDGGRLRVAMLAFCLVSGVSIILRAALG